MDVSVLEHGMVLRMCWAIINQQENFATFHSFIKPFEVVFKDCRQHPSFAVVAIFDSKIIDVDIYEATRILVLADNPERNFVRSIIIRTNCNCESFFRLLLSLKLLGCKRVI